MASQPRTYARLQLVAAVLLGALIYQWFVVDLSGILAAIAISPEYFAWFGKERQALALALLQLTSAVFVVTLVCIGVFAAGRMFTLATKPLLMCLLGGMLLCLAYWTATFLLLLPVELQQGEEPFALIARLRQFTFLQWWDLPTTVAPWLGFGLAAWLLSRRAVR